MRRNTAGSQQGGYRSAVAAPGALLPRCLIVKKGADDAQNEDHAKQAGRKPVRDERDRKLEQLERDKAKLQRELALARKVIELAGKAHEILGVALPSLENDETL